MPLNEHVYRVAIAFKMTERVQQQTCIKFCIKLHYTTETIQMTQKATANWWLAASSQQCASSCITSHTEIFGKTSNHPGDSAPLQPRFGAAWLLAFPKTKITFEREEILDCWWDSGKNDGAADDDSNKGFCRVFWTVEETLGKLCEVPRCLLWRGLRRHGLMYNVFCILSFQ